MLSVSATEGVHERCGLARNPATMYPSTRGCLRRLKISVITPAHIRMSARSLIIGAKEDISAIHFMFDVQIYFLLGKVRRIMTGFSHKKKKYNRKQTTIYLFKTFFNFRKNDLPKQTP
jgi:hypothetical protein